MKFATVAMIAAVSAHDHVFVHFYVEKYCMEVEGHDIYKTYTMEKAEHWAKKHAHEIHFKDGKCDHKHWNHSILEKVTPHNDLHLHIFDHH